MQLSELLKPEGGQAAAFSIELRRRAGACYEQAGLWQEAASCWQEAGDQSRAADCYLHLGDYAKLAPLLFFQKQYAEALHYYRQWLEAAGEEEEVAIVTARLGIAACLFMMQAEPEAALASYRAARALIEKHAEPGRPGTAHMKPPAEIEKLREEIQAMEGQKNEAIARLDFEKSARLREQERKLKNKLEAAWQKWNERLRTLTETSNPELVPARCWEALGAYGAMIRRYDLVQVGYERALALYTERHNAERLRAGQDYLAALEANHLLKNDLAARLAEWSAL